VTPRGLTRLASALRRDASFDRLVGGHKRVWFCGTVTACPTITRGSPHRSDKDPGSELPIIDVERAWNPAGEYCK
jgi:hypothetical protein